MYRSVKTIHPDVFCSNETVKNIVGIIGAQTSQVNIYMLLYIILALNGTSKKMSANMVKAFGKLWTWPKFVYY